MSYEGYIQVLCRRGHLSSLPVDYAGDGPRYTQQGYEEHIKSRQQAAAEGYDTSHWAEPSLWKCEDCGELMGWYNNVDDTNCDAVGDMAFELTHQAVTQTCNLGHSHVIQEQRYRPGKRTNQEELRSGESQDCGSYINGGLITEE